MIDRLYWSIVEKGDGKCNIVHTAIEKSGFIELNERVYSPDISQSDCQS